MCFFPKSKTFRINFLAHFFMLPVKEMIRRIPALLPQRKDGYTGFERDGRLASLSSSFKEAYETLNS